MKLRIFLFDLLISNPALGEAISGRLGDLLEVLAKVHRDVMFAERVVRDPADLGVILG